MIEKHHLLTANGVTGEAKHGLLETQDRDRGSGIEDRGSGKPGSGKPGSGKPGSREKYKFKQKQMLITQ